MSERASIMQIKVVNLLLPKQMNFDFTPNTWRVIEREGKRVGEGSQQLVQFLCPLSKKQC